MGNPHHPSTPVAFRQHVFRVVSSLYQEAYGPARPGRGSCLHWTMVGVAYLAHLGFRPLFQAGSMSWPLVTPEQDDGVSPTHFTYEWAWPLRPESHAAVLQGNLPEMHVWIGLPDQNEMIDFSTRFLPQQAETMGLAWRTPPPPDYLWCRPSQLPNRVLYKPDLEAIRFVLNLIRHNTIQVNN